MKNSVKEIPRMKVGKKQTFETLISEEALLFAKYLRSEKKEWSPRIPSLQRARYHYFLGNKHKNRNLRGAKPHQS